MKLSLVKPTAVTAVLILKDPKTDEVLTNSAGETMSIEVAGMQSQGARNAYLKINRRLKPRNVVQAEKQRPKLLELKSEIEEAYAAEDLDDVKAKQLEIDYKQTVDELDAATSVIEAHSSGIGAEVLAGITVTWAGLEDDKGAIKHNEKNAIALYSANDWIATQVLAFASDEGNFAPKM